MTMPIPTFTLFCYGTGESSGKTENIISQFELSSKNVSLDLSGDNYTEKLKGQEGQQTAISVLDGPGILGWYVDEKATKEFEKICDWLKSQNDDESNYNINLTGFSRGSVTCIRVAIKLAEKINELEVSKEDNQLLTKLKKTNLNMFLMDPVAGPNDKNDENCRKIPSIVKEFTAMHQLHEGRRDFKPQDITRLIFEDRSKTQVSLLPMYGNHSDSTKIKNEKMQCGPRIAWNSLYSFLTKNGTKFAENKMPGIIREGGPLDLPAIEKVDDLLKLFSEYHDEKKSYEISGQALKLHDGIPIPRTERTLNQHLKFYVKNPEFFVNQLDRESFKITYPRTFNYLFERNIQDPRFPGQSDSSPEVVNTELRDEIKTKHPELYSRLMKNGFINEHGKLAREEPQGYYCLEPCASMQQLFPDLVPDNVKNYEHKQDMDDLSTLEGDITQETVRYEREKSEFSFAWDRNQSLKAKKIRADIFSIVTGLKDDEPKKTAILKKLQEHYKAMVYSYSTSQLKDILEDLLVKHQPGFTKQKPKFHPFAIDLYNILTLLKKLVGLIGNLGYIGGGFLYAAGTFIADVGRRINESIGNIGFKSPLDIITSPFKAIFSLVGAIFQGVGTIIKNSFGLKPLTEYLTEKMQAFRDEKVIELNEAHLHSLDDSPDTDIVVSLVTAETTTIPFTTAGPNQHNVVHAPKDNSNQTQTNVDVVEARNVQNEFKRALNVASNGTSIETSTEVALSPTITTPANLFGHVHKHDHDTRSLRQDTTESQKPDNTEHHYR